MERMSKGMEKEGILPWFEEVIVGSISIKNRELKIKENIIVLSLIISYNNLNLQGTDI